MSTSSSLEATKKLVFFPFTGKGWGSKILIGSALSLAGFIIPIIPGIMLLGYAGKVAKRILLEDADPEMPEWKDWGGFLSDGIKYLGVAALYFLPGFLLMIGGYMLMFMTNFIFVAGAGLANSPESFNPTLLIGILVAFAGILIMLFGILLMTASMLFVAPAIGNMIIKDNFSAAFKVKEWWAIFKANLSGFILAMTMIYGISTVLVWISYIFYFTIVLFFIMPFALIVSSFIILMIQFSLMAIAYRDGMLIVASKNAA